MNQISYRLSDIPCVSIADQRIVTVSYKHLDRTRPFHVLLYVLKGQVPIIEDNTEYIIGQGSLFFSKKKLSVVEALKASVCHGVSVTQCFDDIIHG